MKSETIISMGTLLPHDLDDVKAAAGRVSVADLETVLAFIRAASPVGEREERTEPAPLHPDHIRAERRACMFGDVVENHTYAMQAAVIERYAGGGSEKAMDWIQNTLAGPGHMPDLDAAMALPAAKAVGPAQAWFDMKMAEHDAFRAAHPMPAAPAKGGANG